VVELGYSIISGAIFIIFMYIVIFIKDYYELRKALKLKEKIQKEFNDFVDRHNLQ
jgi:hypothetical protein